MRYYISVFFLFSVVINFSQKKHQVNWISIDDLQDSLRINEKPILVKIGTSWCGYCKKMDKEAFSYKRVVKELNRNYYAIKLDAESKKQMVWNDTTYYYLMQPGGRGINKLALKLGSDKSGGIKYPTIIVLNADYKKIKFLDGYLPKRSFFTWLKN